MAELLSCQHAGPAAADEISWPPSLLDVAGVVPKLWRRMQPLRPHGGRWPKPSCTGPFWLCRRLLGRCDASLWACVLAGVDAKDDGHVRSLAVLAMVM